MTQLTFGSLFAGIGGLDLGFERAGLECKWQVEIDPYARSVLAKHWPNVHRWDDVRTWPQQNTEYVDVIVGGFPCQDISYAGKGAGINGERSGLWFEFARVVREMGPRFVVVENVAALLSRGLGDVLGTLASLGYDAEWHCIPACAFGAPHIRDRIFVLGWNSNGEYDNSQRSGCAKNTNTDGACNRKNKSKPITDSASENDRFCRTSKIERQISQFGKSSIRDRGSWSVEPAVGRVADGVPNRLDRFRGLGNAVVPQVAEYIGRTILTNL